ncbi:MAG: hypothetical protein OIF32_08430 [Campylobacterales bacterium]|nr:hypothetical protein [Campylobacterales bacterium]
MSYKDDIETIKSDIVGEGKFLEYYMHFESFYKKYKFVIIGIITALVAVFIYSKVSAYQDEQRILAATTAYNKLLENPQDATAKTELQNKSEKLYDLYMLSQVSKSLDPKDLESLASKSGLVGKIATYQLASLSKDPVKLSAARSVEGAVLKELATLESAMVKAQKKDFVGFKAELAKIPATSPMRKTADIIAHLGIKN